MPEAGRYDGYIQLENGVGMLRLLVEEVREALEEEMPEPVKAGIVSVATGLLAYPYICRIAEWMRERFPQRIIRVYPVKNDFFGPMITVSGLLTGRDIVAQLKGADLGDCLLLPENMFRAGEEVFLDDMTRTDAENALQVRARIVKSSGRDLVFALLFPERESDAEHARSLPGEAYGYEGYELDEISDAEGVVQ